MKKIRFRQTEIEVSQLSLGTAQFGTGRSPEECFAQMDAYTERGGNFLDTAHVYGDWAWPEPGRSEEIIGQWLARTKKRSRMVISSKGCHPPLDNMLKSRVDAGNLREDVEGSLRKLKTDYIDLYFLHRDDPSAPAGEILEALEEEVRRGNIRYYGCSNWSLERVREADTYAQAHGLQGFSCNQMMYTLADVEEETLVQPQLTLLDPAFYEYEKAAGLNFMAYMCMAGGYFTRKLAGAEIPASQQERYPGEANERIAGLLKDFAAEGYTVTDFLLRYVTMAEFPSVPIAGFRNPEQLREALDAVEKEVPGEMMDALVCCKQLQRYGF